MRHLFTRIPLVGAVALCTSQLATAQQVHIIEEVMVTAQKRTQSVQDIGIAVTAFTSQQMDELRLTQPVDLAAQTPGLDIKNTVGRSNPVITIRGVGLSDYNTNNSPAAAVHVDEVYLGSNGYLSFQMFDLERVEVLKGPQGTLFGRNTTAGSVNFITNKPSEEFEADLELSYGNYNTIEAKAAVSGALTNNLQGRIAVMRTTADGYQDNLGTDGSSAGFSRVPGVIPGVPLVKRDKDWGDTDVYAWRGSLAWQPSDSVDIGLSIHGSKDESEQIVYKMITPDLLGTPPVGDEFTSYSNVNPEIDAEQGGMNLRVDWDLGFATFTSLTGYEELERTQDEEDSSPLRLVDGVLDDDLDQTSQEFRLTSTSDSDLLWVAGVSWIEDTVDFSKTLDATDLLLGLATTTYVQEGEALAVFGQTEWQFTDTLRLTTGLRYTDEEKTFKGGTVEEDPYGTSVVGSQFPDLPIQANTRYETDDISGKVGLDWTPTDDLLFYVSASKGFKSGGFDGSTLLDLIATTPFGEEVLWAYEVGFKSTFLNNTLQLNGALFYYDFEDMQVEVLRELPGGITESFRTNAGKSELTGSELEAWWRPAQGWDIRAGIAYLDSEITKWDSADPAEAAAFEGNQVPDAPELTYNAIIRYEWSMGSDLLMSASTDFNYNDDVFKTADNDPDFAAEDFLLWNARVALSSDSGSWTVAMWGKNLSDEVYETNRNNPIGWVNATYGMPRTYGISLDYSWR